MIHTSNQRVHRARIHIFCDKKNEIQEVVRLGTKQNETSRLFLEIQLPFEKILRSGAQVSLFSDQGNAF